VNEKLIQELVNAVLYEGYILYPYRPTSAKNGRQRFTFGRVYPEAYSVAQEGAEPCEMRTECLVRASGAQPRLEVRVRFLQPIWREAKSWHEAAEREINIPLCSLEEIGSSISNPFTFPEESDRDVAGTFRRRANISGCVEASVEPMGQAVWRVSVRVRNLSALSGDEAKNEQAVIMRTFASTHAVLVARNAKFLSLTDPPAEFQTESARCQNVGVWPVLVGDEAMQENDTMLASPIILSDYPKIAPESAGDLFDGAEIDEILTLRILTMTDAEKVEMRAVDAHARKLLERTEAMAPEDLLKLHGTMREARSFDEQIFGSSSRLQEAQVEGVAVRAGDRVRVRPKSRADVMDMAIAGRVAIVEAIEQDAEARIHVAVVIEDDPGKDLGLLRQSGHRFFYGLDEIEPLVAEEVRA
jgi:hypothetical protein